MNGSTGIPQVSTGRPAIGPRLRRLLRAVLALVAILVANSIYLVAVRLWGAAGGAASATQNYFYLWMVLLHLALGVIVIVPFVAFAGLHIRAARGKPNSVAIRRGYALAASGAVLAITGLLLLRVGGLKINDPAWRMGVFAIHVMSPVVAACLYWRHRRSGPPLRRRSAVWYGGAVFAGLLAMITMHGSRPTPVSQPSTPGQTVSFAPSLVSTASGEHLPAETLMMDSYCMKCHPDVYEGWFHSAHHFSSFNNPMYLASIRETRAAVLKRDGNVAAARWCAGCHDPVTLLSGAFDDPNFDDVRHPTAQAGITCTVCHAVTAVNSSRGNADFTISAPVHYPFTGSEHPLLRYVNEQLIKAKPSFHKQTFLRPLHESSEFCGTCHKVHLPKELNGYRDFLRGQNHFDSFMLSGVSGHGVRSSYYPMQASENCGTCHMPEQLSADFGARPSRKSGKTVVHDHLFPGANTALPWLRNEQAIIERHQDFLRKAARVDIVALREGGTLDGDVHVPLRDNLWLKDSHRTEHAEAVELMQQQRALPVLQPGGRYLVDVVIRNRMTGHHFTQGTADSNEIWLDFVVRSGDRIIGRSGGMDENRRVDRTAHFVNAYVIDKDGRRIERRNPQDIFTVLYNHQIGPGSSQVVHYLLHVPEDVTDVVTVEATLRYRKFDAGYMQFVADSAKPDDLPVRGIVRGEPVRNELPVTTVAADRLILPVEGVDREVPRQEYPIPVDHVSQRWLDYGIALMKEGANTVPGEQAGTELRLAEQVFLEADRKFGYASTRLHLVQLYLMEGRIDEAATAINRLHSYAKPLFFQEPVYSPWSIAWLSGLISKQQGDLDKAIRNFQSILEYQDRQLLDHGYDLSRDYVVINELGRTLVERSRQESGPSRAQSAAEFLEKAADQFRTTLQLDTENAEAHYNLALIHELLGDPDTADEHRRLHLRYKPDDNAQDRARFLARQRDAAANHEAERIVIHMLHGPKASDELSASFDADDSPSGVPGEDVR